MPKPIFVVCFVAISSLSLSSAEAATVTNHFAGSRGGNQIPYRLRLPDGHDTSSTNFPLIIRLHGGGNRGDDLGIGFGPTPGLANEMITIAPQAPIGTTWTNTTVQSYVKDVIDYETANLRVDPNRIYLQGYSMGGFGTYSFARAFPDTFAAASAIAGGGGAAGPYPTDVAFWSFHGDQDAVVSPVFGQQSVDALSAAGAYVRYTTYPDYGHGTSTDPFESQNITQKSRSPAYYDWLFAQELGTPHNYELGIYDGSNLETAGFYEPGSDYVITARAPDTANGERFAGWMSVGGTLFPNTTTSPWEALGSELFADADALNTTFTMPAYDTVVFASYVTAIPEPSTFALSMLGCLTLGMFKPRRRSSNRPAFER